MATKKKKASTRTAKKKPAAAAKRVVAKKKPVASAKKTVAKKKPAASAKKAVAKKKPVASAKKAVAKKKPAASAKKAVAKKKPAASAKKAVAKKKPAAAEKSKTVAIAKAPKKPSVAAKKRSAAKPIPATPAPQVRRRDGAGHLDAHYAATLREKSLEGQVRDRDDAFIGREGHTKDNLAEALGETWVATATSGEDENEDVFSQGVPEDEGGPFVTTTAGQEFAEGTDASNPERSKREPFPKT
jgi:hypothetical protein